MTMAFTDYNKQQIDGTVAEVNDIAPLAEKWAAFGWNVIDVEDGNDIEQVEKAVAAAKTCAALPAHCVNFIYKEDTGGIFLCLRSCPLL